MQATSSASSEEDVCYIYGSSEHLARDCSGRRQPATSKTSGGSVQIMSISVIQPAVLPDPYMISLKISPSEKRDKVNTYIIDAIIDSGSLISIIRNSIVDKEVCSPIVEDTDQFYRINGSRLSILSIFYGEIEIQSVRTTIKFYTVPDIAMAHKVLLGRDFLACPSYELHLKILLKLKVLKKQALGKY
ncbi:hypothetical protein P5V15_004408 [Pogonomyrmex californicus]